MESAGNLMQGLPEKAPARRGGRAASGSKRSSTGGTPAKPRAAGSGKRGRGKAKKVP